jgi:hypothetical protein
MNCQLLRMANFHLFCKTPPHLIHPSLCKEFRATNTPYESLKKLRFSITSGGDHGFFTHLCSRLPNLSHLELDMTREEDIIRFGTLHMPTTDFEELSIKITRDDRPDWKANSNPYGLYTGAHVNETLNIVISTKDDFSTTSFLE